MVMESLQRLDPPQALGKLTLLARLGEGGMATVYVAAAGHGPLARLCAVKLLRADVPDPDYRRRFVDEATLVVRLHHNNLVDVREAGEHNGQLYIVMELCEGRDLADLWDRCAQAGRAFPVPLSVYLVREALRGLHYAHTFGGLSLVHRDISPSNLLIDWAGAVRVADFGLATSVLKATATMPGMVFGKVGYMAPEQATRGELDGRADVYSCGVVLWELLTGRPLRESGLDTDAVARFTAKRPSMLSRRVEAALDDIVMRALAPEPDARFADASHFMRALSDWLVRNAPQTDQESFAEFMRSLFPEAEIRDHENYGALLGGVAGPTTGVFRRGDTRDLTRDAMPVVDGEDLPEGMVVGERYRIAKELGRGGMGTVYLAEHVTVGRKVAVKVLTREWSAHATVARRFREEARAASAAGHPNIVEVFDAGVLPDGRLYLVMEYLQGRSLYDELCATGPLPVERAVSIFREIARGIAAAHAVGIMHRDLKPDNVMLVERGGETTVKILDFGIAASADRVAEDRRLTQPGHTLGTPEYMAPEQAKGRAPTELVDVYALGAMLYEMLVGEPPFVGANYVEVLTRKAAELPPRLEGRRNDLPPHLVTLCHACLEIDPLRRPPSALALLAGLEPAPGTALVAAELPPPPREAKLAVIRAPGPLSVRVPPVPPRRSFAVPLAIGAFVAMLGLGVGAWRWAAVRDGAAPAVVDAGAVATPSVEVADDVDGGRSADAVATSASAVASSPDPAADSGTAAAAVPAPDPAAVPSPDPRALPDDPAIAPSIDPDPAAAPTEPVTAKPAVRPVTTADSRECDEHRAAAKKSRIAGDWSAVLANVRTRSCWSGSHRGDALELQLNALFELQRLGECVKIGAKARTEVTQQLTSKCLKKLGASARP